MLRSGAFLGGLAAAMLVFAAWTALDLQRIVSADAAKDLLANRAWVERMPRSKKDLVTWFVPMDLKGKKFGVAQRSSHYAFAGERFVYERDGDRLALTFQQTERKAKLTARAYECKGKAPKPFDLCLDLKAGNDEATFYSKRSWKVPGSGADPELPAFDLTPIDDEAVSPREPNDALRLLLYPGGF